MERIILEKKNIQLEKFYLGKHALHGILYNKAFTVISETANENFMRLLQ